MEENLISKKELLEVKGISYGQLYRWKRKKLIPEEWFIKKSAFTGQETFFPREEVMSRIDKILNMKDGLSLDEIANVLTPDLGDVCFEYEKIKEKDIINSLSMELFTSVKGNMDTLSIQNILCIYIVDKFMRSGKVSLDEGKVILKEIDRRNENDINGDNEIILYRKFGVPFIIIKDRKNEIYVDSESNCVQTESMQKNLEELKGVLS